MADTTADQGGMKKTLSLWNFFTIGFGAIIGTGWVLQVGDWMVVGGGPVPAMIAFLIGAIFLVPIGAVFGELTAAIPISGGIVEYVDRTFGRVPSYITGWFLALGNGILCPWEAIAISTLLSDMFGTIPGLEWLRAFELYEILGAKVYLFPTLISLGFAAYVIFLNFRGASSAAKLQAFLTKALLCGMLLAMGISILHRFPGERPCRRPGLLPGLRCWRRCRGDGCRQHLLAVCLSRPVADPLLLCWFRYHSPAGRGGSRGPQLEQVRQDHLPRPACLRRLLHGVHLLLRHHPALAGLC